MATTARAATAVFPAPPGQQEQVEHLLQLQKAAKKINSILDLEALIDTIVSDVVCKFGCLEANIFLRHETRPEMIAAGCQGCTVHGKGHSLKIGQEGMVGHVAFTGKMHYAPDVSRDPYYLACEEAAMSAVAIPLRNGDRVIGVFNAAHPELDGFSRGQLQLLHALAEHIAIAVENARLFQRERELNERHSKEADEARHIQQQLLPNSSLLLPDFFVTGATLPAGAVGGDWYDYIELPGGKWGFVLADVSRKRNGRGVAHVRYSRSISCHCGERPESRRSFAANQSILAARLSCWPVCHHDLWGARSGAAYVHLRQCGTSLAGLL